VADTDSFLNWSYEDEQDNNPRPRHQVTRSRPRRKNYLKTVSWQGTVSRHENRQINDTLTFFYSSRALEPLGELVPLKHMPQRESQWQVFRLKAQTELNRLATA